MSDQPHDQGGASRPGTLQLIPMPLGNADDMSARAVQTLSAVDIVAAEDTRTFWALVRRLGIKPAPRHVVSYHDHNEKDRTPWLVEQLQAGKSVALVSEAGMPNLTDPGYHIVSAAISAGLAVTCLPGPCAAVTALAASGLPASSFHFAGFLPRQPGKRDEAILRLSRLDATLVLYEAPHRAIKTLRALAAGLGARRAVIGWNLSRENERYLRGQLDGLADELESWEYVHGQMTLVVEGRGREEPSLGVESQETIQRWIERGIDPTMMRELVSDLLGVSRNAAYAAVVQARRAIGDDDE